MEMSQYATTLDIAEAASATARKIRAKKGRTAGRMLGADRQDEQQLEDLAGSWDDFAKTLRRQDRKKWTETAGYQAGMRSEKRGDDITG